MKKIIMMILFVMAYLFIPAINKVTSKEINYAYLSSYVAANLYSEDSFVSTNNKLLVKDYLLKDKYLYIFPLNNKIELPFGVMVSKVCDYYIEVIDLDEIYRIYRVDKKDALLYQYIGAFSSIGTTLDYYVIESESLDKIINNLDIYYVQI